MALLNSLFLALWPCMIPHRKAERTRGVRISELARKEWMEVMSSRYDFSGGCQIIVDGCLVGLQMRLVPPVCSKYQIFSPKAGCPKSRQKIYKYYQCGFGGRSVRFRAVWQDFCYKKTLHQLKMSSLSNPIIIPTRRLIPPKQGKLRGDGV
jgi:hypothetical protein